MLGKLISLAVALLAITVYCSLYGPTLDPYNSFEPESLRGKRVLITGASSGIGEELAYVYSRYGASVMVTARRADLLSRVTAKCRELGAQSAEQVVGDMALAKDRERLVVAVKQKLGGLDYLVLNHAFMDLATWTGAAENMTSLRQGLEINFVSYVDLTSSFLDMLDASQGAIGVVSSLAGKMPHPYASIYTATKFALQGFYSTLRHELIISRSRVTITLLVLGRIDTEQVRTQMQAHFPDYYQAGVRGVPANNTADAIVRAVGGRTIELWYPFHDALVILAHKFFPGYIENVIAYTLGSSWK